MNFIRARGVPRLIAASALLVSLTFSSLQVKTSSSFLTQIKLTRSMRPFLGPNTVTRNGSAILTHEVEVDYIVQLMAPLVHRPTLSLRVPYAAFHSFNAVMSVDLAKSALTAASCPPSWFRADGGTGANFSTWPGSIYGFWWAMRKVRWEEYEVSDKQGRVVDMSGSTKWTEVLELVLGASVFAGAGVGWWWQRTRLIGAAERLTKAPR